MLDRPLSYYGREGAGTPCGAQHSVRTPRTALHPRTNVGDALGGSGGGIAGPSHTSVSTPGRDGKENMSLKDVIRALQRNDSAVRRRVSSRRRSSQRVDPAGYLGTPPIPVQRSQSCKSYFQEKERLLATPPPVLQTRPIHLPVQRGTTTDSPRPRTPLSEPHASVQDSFSHELSASLAAGDDLAEVLRQGTRAAHRRHAAKPRPTDVAPAVSSQRSTLVKDARHPRTHDMDCSLPSLASSASTSSTNASSAPSVSPSLATQRPLPPLPPPSPPQRDSLNKKLSKLEVELQHEIHALSTSPPKSYGRTTLVKKPPFRTTPAFQCPELCLHVLDAERRPELKHTDALYSAQSLRSQQAAVYIVAPNFSNVE